MQLRPRGYPLISWLWWPGAGAPGSYIWYQWERESWVGYHPRAPHRQQTERHPLVFLSKRPAAYPGAWPAGVGLRFGTQRPSALKEWRQVDATLELSFSLLTATNISLERAYTLHWSLNFYHCPEGTLPDPLALEVGRVSMSIPTRLYIFAYFKNCLRVWLLTSLQSDAILALPFGTHSGLGAPSTTGSH